MKKTFTLIAALIASAAMVKAETGCPPKTNTTTECNTTTTECNATTECNSTTGCNASAVTNTTLEIKDLSYWAKAVAERVKVTGYAQAGYTATMPEGGKNTNTFDMKRVVLMVAANITPQFYAFFMHEFKTKDMQEYYLEYRPAKEFKMRLGQSKIELSMENPMSPTVLESIGPMAQSVSWLCGADPLMGNPSGRDMGLMIYGDLFNDQLRYVLELVNGGHINSSDLDNKKNLIAKLEYRPVPNFRLSASGQLGYGTAVATSLYNNTVALGETYKQNRYAVGAEWKSKLTGNDYHNHRCIMVRAEMLGGKDGGCKSSGAYISTAIPVYKGLDIVAMADYMNYNTDLDLTKTNLMAGIQYWIFKKCRLQAQYTYSLRNDAMKALQGDNTSMIQTQIQVAF